MVHVTWLLLLETKMSAIEYNQLSDEEKLELLQVLYHDLKKKDKITARDIEQKELVIAETQIVYNRIKMRSH